jgi:hypothetical protein
MRVSASAQRSTAAETMHGPSSATRRKAPSASAMDPEHSSESDRRVSVAAQLSSERGRVRLLDRAACVLGGRWCAANLRAPLSPPEGSSPPRELRPSMKLESRSSPCGYGAELCRARGQLVGITMQVAGAPVLAAGSGIPAHQKPMTTGGRR